MQPRKEQRRFKRYEREVDLIANIFQKKEKANQSFNIPLKTINISKAGLMGLWPKGWQCPSCKKCLFWILNADCRLKPNDANGDSTKPLPIGCCLRLRSAGPHIQDIDAEVAWIRYSPEADSYVVGMRFLQEMPSLPF
ncbi:MAG: hypothetical protein JW867_03300 [Candidatus Omnitrophica bacterium]|nr:hypothetical protein [Candidatus Omnitrophota bacterium]